MLVLSREAANPRCAIHALARFGFFDVLTEQADRDESLRVVVKIEGPIVSYEAVQVDCPILSAPKLPAHEIQRAEPIAVHVLHFEMPIEEVDKLHSVDPHLPHHSRL